MPAMFEQPKQQQREPSDRSPDHGTPVVPCTVSHLASHGSSPIRPPGGLRRLRAVGTSLFIIVWTTILSMTALVTFPFSPRGRCFFWLARVWSRSIFAVAGVQVRTACSPHLRPDENYVYLATHESLTDILALFCALPQNVVMVAKRSLLILPLFSWGMWLAGFVFINRSSRAKALRSMEQAGRRLPKGRSILVFPEGTRSDGTGVGSLKKGGFILAQRAKLRVIPLGIFGTHGVLPRDTFPVYPGRISIAIGDPMPPPSEGESLDAYVARTHAQLVSLRKQAQALWPF